MLVLTRREGESIVIEDNILVSVVSIDGERVRLGIIAPASIPVDRQEIHVRRLAHPDGPPRAATAKATGEAPAKS